MTENKIPETEQEILSYVKNNAEEGRVRDPITTIAERTGYSPATVHRALRALEQRNLIRIIPSRLKRMPNTVEYVGEQPERMHIMERGYRAADELHFVFTFLDSQLAEREREIAELQARLREYETRFGEVDQEVVLPDGTRMLVLKKAEK